jgi:hypothetical protein
MYVCMQIYIYIYIYGNDHPDADAGPLTYTQSESKKGRVNALMLVHDFLEEELNSVENREFPVVSSARVRVPSAERAPHNPFDNPFLKAPSLRLERRDNTPGDQENTEEPQRERRWGGDKEDTRRVRTDSREIQIPNTPTDVSATTATSPAPQGSVRFSPMPAPRGIGRAYAC